MYYAVLLHNKVQTSLH